MFCIPHFKIWKRVFVLLLICVFLINIRSSAQLLPYQYNKTEIKLQADFIAYGQHPRAVNQTAKQSVLQEFLSLNAQEEVYVLLDYPTSLNQYLSANTTDFKSVEKELYLHYQSNSYIELQLQKIKGIVELTQKHPAATIKCVGANINSKNYDSLLYINIKNTISSNFKKTFYIGNPLNTIKYYYPEEYFSGNKFSSISMLNTDTLFHDKTIISISEAAKFIENMNNEGLIKSIAYIGLRNYQRDRVNLIPFKNENFICVDLWEYLAENNLTFDYLILFNEMHYNK